MPRRQSLMSDQNAAPENKTDEAPEWARKAISEANSEAAKYRVEKNSLKQQLDEVLGKNSELTDKVAEVEKAHSAAQQELLKLRVALDAGVPGEHVRMVAERLQGTTEEELKADAAKLVQTFKLDQSRHLPIDPSQGRGRDQNSGPIDNSPQAQFAYMWNELFSNKR